MEAPTPPSPSTQKYEPNTEAIKLRLLKRGINPTPKILHSLRKKHLQKHTRKLNKISQTQNPPPLTPSQKQALAEESHFRTLKREYRGLTAAIKAKTSGETSGLLVGKPWEGAGLRGVAGGGEGFGGGKLKREDLRELKGVLEDGLRWVFDDDVEMGDDGVGWLSERGQLGEPARRRRRCEGEAIGFLVDRLCAREVTVRDWKLARMMKQSGLRFGEGQLLKIVEGLGNKGKWEQALTVVEWIYNDKGRRDCKSRFVYTKLLSVLGKEKRPQEALHIFNLMREDFNIYPDMAAYHSIAVTLGQAGFLKELVKTIDCMRQKPSKRIYNMRHKNWDPTLEPDLIIYNAVLNACVPSRQWKGVFWVFDQLRKSGLKPNGATYGLAMEVMLNSRKYDLVHEFFMKMNRSGESPKALTYKVLVRAFWEEGKVSEAVEAVREMERRGVVGTASVYYELACCLCYNGRWRDAMHEVEKIKGVRDSKPMVYTFTGLIQSSMAGGHLNDCISIFEYMKTYCPPNIGTINTMLKVYSQNDMFSKARLLVEEIKGNYRRGNSLIPDEYTYSAMLAISAGALQWEYFEHVYREMIFSGYQLDQSKHASLLVEASRAGKGHLLEHAFDTILEAGEIPHPMFFTEMIFQAAAQHDYERAVTLVNTIAHAPFQISEKQWMDLFGSNGDKIKRDNLEKLLNALSKCHVTSGATFSNLVTSLRHLCGSETSKYLLSAVASGIEDTVNSYLETNDSEISDSKKGLLTSSSGARMVENPQDGEGSLVNKLDVSFDAFYISQSSSASSEGKDSIDMVSSLPVSVTESNGMTNQCTMEVHTDKVACDETVNSFDKYVLNFVFDEGFNDFDGERAISIGEVDDSEACKLPSASEILEGWKEKRKEDGIFLPFHLGRKNVSASVPKDVKIN